jgi:hypothetical protein
MQRSIVENEGWLYQMARIERHIVLSYERSQLSFFIKLFRR